MKKLSMLQIMAATLGAMDVVAGNFATPSKPSWKELQTDEEREYMLEKARLKRKRKLANKKHK